jgi:hypothetical protein
MNRLAGVSAISSQIIRTMSTGRSAEARRTTAISEGRTLTYELVDSTFCVSCCLGECRDGLVTYPQVPSGLIEPGVGVGLAEGADENEGIVHEGMIIVQLPL